MRSGSSVILMALALADTLALVLGLLTGYLKGVFEININDIFIICKLQRRYLKSVFSYSANWILIVFTIFRVIAVYRLILPHKANIYCTRKRAHIAVIVTLLIACLSNLDELIYMDTYPQLQEW